MMEILEMKNAWAESIHFVNNCITEIPDGTSCHDDILWFLTIQIIYTRYNPKIWKIKIQPEIELGMLSLFVNLALISSCMPVGMLDGFVKYVNNFNGVDVVACNIFLRALGYA